MQIKQIKTLFIASVFAFESILAGCTSVNAQIVSENSAPKQEESTEFVEESGEISSETASIRYKGTDGDLTWTINSDGLLTISGIGDFKQREWKKYDDYIKNAVVNVTGITDTSHMFSDCRQLESIEFVKFDTSQVTDMSDMFYYCSSLTSLDFSGLDTGRVTDMSGMFEFCSSLTSLNFSGLDTGRVTDMSSMFHGCKNLVNLDLRDLDTYRVTMMDWMFYGCSSLVSLDLSSLDTSRVTNMQEMFYDCTGLTRLDLSGLDTSRVEDMDSMFYNCSSLTGLDLSGFDMCNVEDVEEIFFHCNSLTNIKMSAMLPTAEDCVIELPTVSGYYWALENSGSSNAHTKVSVGGTYVRLKNGTVLLPNPQAVGTRLNGADITTQDGAIPATASFTVTSSTQGNPTASFDGVTDENAIAVTIPKTIIHKGVTYKVTTVSFKSFINKKDGAEYTVVDNRVGSLTVSYKRPTNKKKTQITVPASTTYKGVKFKVTGISASAFKNNNKVKTITIGNTITTIGKNAFQNCKKLLKIKIKSSKLTKVGSQALKGVNAKCKIQVPKAKLSKYKKLFKNKGQKKTVKVTK